MNTELVELVKEFEGFSKKPYLCSAGVPTIGYGTTRYPSGMKVLMTDDQISEELASTMLEMELVHLFIQVQFYCGHRSIKLNQRQENVLVSFAYNLGLDPIFNPKRSLCISLEQYKITKDVSVVQNAIMLYCKATVNGEKKVISGLVKRRMKEARLFGEVNPTSMSD